MKTRDQLNTDIQINILEELQKANEPVKQVQLISKAQQRSNALAAFMAKQGKPNDKMFNGLQTFYQNR